MTQPVGQFLTAVKLLQGGKRWRERIALEQASFFLLLHWVHTYTDSPVPGREVLRRDWASTYSVRERAAELSTFLRHNLFPYLEEAAKSGPGSVLSILARQEALMQELPEHVSDALSLINALPLADEEVRFQLYQAYQDLLVALPPAPGTVGLTLSDSLAQLVFAVLGTGPDLVLLDVTCGSSSLLAEAMAQIKERTGGTRPIEAIGLADGQEAQRRVGLLAAMNAVLRVGEAPNIRLADSLEALKQTPMADRFLMNPPFGRAPDLTRDQHGHTRLEAAFLALTMERLNPVGGRAGVILPRGFFARQSKSVRQLGERLLTKFCVLSVIELPAGTFRGTGVQTMLLTFESGGSTDQILYYRVPRVKSAAGQSEAFAAAAAYCTTWLDQSRLGGELPPPPAGADLWIESHESIRAREYDLSPRPSLPESPSYPPVREVLESLEASANQLSQRIQDLRALTEKGVPSC